MIAQASIRVDPTSGVIVAARSVPHAWDMTPDNLRRFAHDHPGWAFIMAGSVHSPFIGAPFVTNDAEWRA